MREVKKDIHSFNLSITADGEIPFPLQNSLAQSITATRKHPTKIATYPRKERK